MLAVVAALCIAAPTYAFPGLPSSFYGVVKMGNANVVTTTLVSAWINGVKYSERTVSMYDGDTTYGLDVLGDDPQTPGIKDGGVAGDMITFKVNGVVAASNVPWQAGTNRLQDLKVKALYLPMIAH
jgi:hypothetical protein